MVPYLMHVSSGTFEMLTHKKWLWPHYVCVACNTIMAHVSALAGCFRAGMLKDGAAMKLSD